MNGQRFGIGFDTHPPAPARPLLLAGVRFEGEPGLEGHSDADVVCHALADALLGAAGLGDIGDHFPDDAPETEGLEGLELLRRSLALVADAGFAPESCDLVLILERPRIAGRREEMRANIADVLSVGMERVSLKATRPEGLGLSGDGAGCLALAVLSAR